MSIFVITVKSLLKKSYKMNNFLPSRRFFLQTSLLPLAITACSYKPPKIQGDILIIGAGAAGLAAAYYLKNNNIGFMLTEASNRVGGRIQTIYDFNQNIIEQGGEFFQKNHTTLINLAQSFNLKITKQDPYKNAIFYFNKTIYTENDFLQAIQPLILKVKTILDRIFHGAREQTITYQSAAIFNEAKQYDMLTVAEFLETLDLKTWIKETILLAYQPKQSALAFILEIQNDFLQEYYKIQAGNGQLIEKLKEQVSDNIYYYYKLIKIEARNSCILCTFDTPSGKKIFRANKIISTLPFNLLKTIEGIETLELEDNLLNYINALDYSTYTKTHLGFSNSFWQEKQRYLPESSGTLYSDLISQQYWANNTIIANYLGQKAGQYAQQEQITTALNNLSQLYPQAKLYFNQGITKNWFQDPYAKGAFSYLQTGQYTTLRGLDMQWNNRIFFAGEQSSIAFAGTMNGALESGIAAAKMLVY